VFSPDCAGDLAYFPMDSGGRLCCVQLYLACITLPYVSYGILNAGEARGRNYAGILASPNPLMELMEEDLKAEAVARAAVDSLAMVGVYLV
jgi:hypothetical protein